MHDRCNKKRSMNSNPLSRRRSQQQASTSSTSTSTTNIKATTAQASTSSRNQPHHRPTWTNSDRPYLFRLTCLLVLSLIFLYCIIKSHMLLGQHDNQTFYFEISSEADRCELQDAFRRGDFWVGSHRSLVDSQWTQEKQPTCLEGLQELYAHRVHYLDVDLIFDPIQKHLVVAHPMEFTGTTQVYSPCAKLPLETVLQLLDEAMSRSSWFVSLEPKADWDRIEDANSVLQEPIILLEQTLAVLQKLNIQPTQCTYIIDATKVTPHEMAFVTKIANHCSMALAMKRQDSGKTLQIAAQLLHYGYLAPTIEFHPTHPNYLATTGSDSLHMVQQSIPEDAKTIYWIVDTTQDLERVAQLLKGLKGGIVSNRPLEIVRILTESQSKVVPKTETKKHFRKVKIDIHLYTIRCCETILCTYKILEKRLR